MANADTSSPRVTPARVNFLAIYNTTLGDTEETEKEQIVFWAGRKELDGKRKSRPTARQGSSAVKKGDLNEDDEEPKKKTEEEELNERLRQIGLARGMVEFAKNFARDSPLDTIETDRSRIVLHELEPDWWILASIDLTQLPLMQKQNESATTSSKTSKQSSTRQQPPSEYSSREVSPTVLLRAQLIKAHNLFLLHHAANLWDVYHRLGRDPFCAILGRYWEKFARLWWDVLLHGNPAVDVYGDCTKLAGGGELGVGVGEEEWGSGEREVLEGFIERTEGCVEFLVGRYGSAPAEKPRKGGEKENPNGGRAEEVVGSTTENVERTTWLGAGEDPGPADGIIFSGIGTVSKKSLAVVSQWMESIFRYGDTAYGVGDNPSARPRQRRKRPRISKRISEESTGTTNDEEQSAPPEVHPRRKSPRSKKPDLRRQAIENNAAPPGLPPGIPAPLVGTVERDLHEALTEAAERGSGKAPGSGSQRGKPQDEATVAEAGSKEESSIFSMVGMKNVLSLGYGSSWTLNPKGFEKKEEDGSNAKGTSTTDTTDKSDKEARRTRRSRSASGDRTASPDRASKDHPTPRRSFSGSRSVEDGQVSTTNTNIFNGTPALQQSVLGSKPSGERLQEIDPTPEMSDEDPLFQQRLEQSIGKFLIGLSGDLENMEFEDTDESVDAAGDRARHRQPRLFHRTLTVELANARYRRPGFSTKDRSISQASKLSKLSAESVTSTKSHSGPEPKTSAAASVDGASPTTRYEKMQVAVYVHQPFIFVFLFELHTPNLTMPSFYRSIHHQLGPLQKPLLQRTDPGRVAERIAAALNEKNSAALSAVKRHVDNGNAVYDLVYDPSRRTVRTSIPNIPIPASPEVAVKTTSTVSGSWYTLGIPIGTSGSAPASRADSVGTRARIEQWSRVEALNVHMQMLNTFVATRNANELEHTVKTSRGWWVLWMKVLPPGKEDSKHNEAFLMRKSADYLAKPVKDSRSTNAGRWLLRDQTRDVSSGSSGGGGGLLGGAKGVSEGVGVDAKKWIEGLLSLTQ